MNFQNDPANQDENDPININKILSQMGMTSGVDLIGKALGMQDNNAFNKVRSSMTFGILPSLTKGGK